MILRDKDRQWGTYPAALRITAPLCPGVAVVGTIAAYLVLGQVGKRIGHIPFRLTEASWDVVYGDFAVGIGLLIGILTWFTVALFYYPYTAAYYVSRRNYNGLRERLDSLEIRVDESEKYISQQQPKDSVLGALRSQALARAQRERDKIREGLASKGMPWVTGLGYIELWHRVHRAEEALVKIEPCVEVLEGAMRDEARLLNANMENSKELLEHLQKASNVLNNTGTSVLSEPVQSSADDNNPQVTPEERMKARSMLSEVHYEINNFRDNSWEGLVHLRNRLADTVVLLGLATYALLALAIFLEAPPKAIIWAVTYFLIGAIAGLFARAQAEWGQETAVDDFGLSKTRLLQVPWLSGLAATGGVVVTSILDPQTSSVDLASVFSNRPALLFVAAIFGVTPNLLVQRLDDQADKTKDDLESTKSSQSTEQSQSSRGRHRRSASSARAK